MTKEDIKEHCELMLGGADVSVDVGEPDADPGSLIDRIVIRSLQTYNRWSPLRRSGFIQATSSVQKYDLTALGKSFGKAIIDVRPPVNATAQSTLESSLLGLGQNILPIRSTRGLIDFVAREAELAQLRRGLALDHDWEFQFEDVDGVEHGVLYVSPPPTSSTEFEYIYAEDCVLGDIPSADEEWFLDFCLALSKLAIGHARRKWSSASPSVRMDGAELVTEGSREKLDLEKDIRRRGFAIGGVLAQG